MHNCTTKFNKKESSKLISPLIKELNKIPDKRKSRGKRHSLNLILGIVLLGFLKGKTSIEACHSFSKARLKWFNKWFGDMLHGIPDPTTIVRALSVQSPKKIIKVITDFFDKILNQSQQVKSLDGKTIKAIYGLKDTVTHMLSLFSSYGMILDQEGVKCKENEITATPRLLGRQVLLGSTITADALLTQKKITKAIIENHGDYLLPVKDNHPDLQNIIKPTFEDGLSKIDVSSISETRKTRSITTTISLTKSFDMESLREDGWVCISQIGKLERKGWRIHKGRKTEINETIYLIASNPSLRPQTALEINRCHWGIENKLHWQKDYTWFEDRQRCKTKKAPEILSFLRSVAVSALRQVTSSITKTLNEFDENPVAYKKMLTKLNIV